MFFFSAIDNNRTGIVHCQFALFSILARQELDQNNTI